MLSEAQFSVLYPNLALFAQEKGWRCGKSFISWRNRCYTNPKTGKKLGYKYEINPKTGRRRKVRVGLNYKEYQKARTKALKKRGQGKNLTSLEQKYIADVERLATSTRKKKQRRVDAKNKRLTAKNKRKAKKVPLQDGISINRQEGKEVNSSKNPAFEHLQKYWLKDREIKKGDLVIDGSASGSHYYNQSVVGVSRDGKRYKLRPRAGLNKEQRELMTSSPGTYDEWVDKAWLYKPGARIWLLETDKYYSKEATGYDKPSTGKVDVSVDYDSYKTKTDPQLIKDESRTKSRDINSTGNLGSFKQPEITTARQDLVKKAIAEQEKVVKQNKDLFDYLQKKEVLGSDLRKQDGYDEQGFNVPNEVTFDNYKDFRNKLRNGQVSAEEVKQYYQAYKRDRDDTLAASLNKLTKKELKPMAGATWSDDKKADLVKGTLNQFDMAFVSGGVLSHGFGEKDRERALDQKVEEWTDDLIQSKAKARAEKLASLKKGLENPETLDEFGTFIRYKGKDKLSTEQRAKYEKLVTDRDRGARKKQEEASKEEKQTAKPVDLPANKTFELAKTYHAKKNHDLYVAKLTERVDRDKFNELKERAKKFGGYYSRYAREGAIPGFQFKDEQSARSFMGLEEIKVADTGIQKQDNSAIKLRAIADSITERASKKLNQDRLVNTARRAKQASSTEADARENLRHAQTMQNIADGIDAGEVQYLDKVKNATEVSQLEKLLIQAKNESARKASVDGMGNHKPGAYDREWEKPITEENIDNAKYPYPRIHRQHIATLAEIARETKGLKQVGDRLNYRARLVANNETKPTYTFSSEQELSDLRKVVEKLKGKTKDYAYDVAKEDLQAYDRIQRLDLKSAAELKTALREYNRYRAKTYKADPIKQKERELIGLKIAGYFPTPKPIVEKLVSAADIKPGQRILEPSAGRGNIAEELRKKAGADAIQTVEIDHRLADILEAKGFTNRKTNFLDIKGETYDRVVMNPPFEQLQDVKHVRHAYNLLAPGGKLVAVMSESPFFNSQKKAKEFREWLDANGGYSEKLPSGSFKNSDRSTGVNTRMVVIEKPYATYSQGLTPVQFSVLYPTLAEFRISDKNLRKRSSFKKTVGGWECGKTFIPANRKCWTHPITGAKLKTPLNYQQYTRLRKQAFNRSQTGQSLSDYDKKLVQSVKRKQTKITKKKQQQKLQSAAKAIGASQVLSTGIAEANPDRIAVDPKRFQYKISGRDTSSGSVGSLKGVKTWDANLAGIVQVWQDPKNKQVYVVNGHNRLDLAKQLDVSQVTVRFLKAKSASEARAIGALTNIAEGRGNAQDAAKFFRDSGLSKADLDKKGIPMREKIATDGLALSNLSDGLFNQVVQGQLPESRAVVIGSKLDDKVQQEALVKLIAKEEKKGRRITNDVISELADMTSTAPKKVEAEQGNIFSLLGFDPDERSLVIEKAQISASVKRQLVRDKKLFGTVGKSKAAKDLAKAGNKINIEESAAISKDAETTLNLFDKVKNYRGGVDDALNKGAERLANNESPEKVKKEAYAEVSRVLQETYKYGKGKRAKRSQTRNKGKYSQADGMNYTQFSVLYPTLVQFSKETGWRCGKSFISYRNRCYTNPKTGQKLGYKYEINPKTGRRRKVRVGLNYKEYQKARTKALKKRGQGKNLTSLEQKYIADVERLATSTRKKKQRVVDARNKRKTKKATEKYKLKRNTEAAKRAKAVELDKQERVKKPDILAKNIGGGTFRVTSGEIDKEDNLKGLANFPVGRKSIQLEFVVDKNNNWQVQRAYGDDKTRERDIAIAKQYIEDNKLELKTHAEAVVTANEKTSEELRQEADKAYWDFSRRRNVNTARLTETNRKVAEAEEAEGRARIWNRPYSKKSEGALNYKGQTIHKRQVERAIKSSKTVPDNVLKQYPDLELIYKDKTPLHTLSRQEYINKFPGTRKKLQETYGELDINKIGSDYVLSYSDRNRDKTTTRGQGKSLKEAAYIFAVRNKLSPDHFLEVDKAVKKGEKVSDRVLRDYGNAFKQDKSLEEIQKERDAAINKNLERIRKARESNRTTSSEVMKNQEDLKTKIKNFKIASSDRETQVKVKSFLSANKSALKEVDKFSSTDPEDLFKTQQKIRRKIENAEDKLRAYDLTSQERNEISKLGEQTWRKAFADLETKKKQNLQTTKDEYVLAEAAKIEQKIKNQPYGRVSNVTSFDREILRKAKAIRKKTTTYSHGLNPVQFSILYPTIAQFTSPGSHIYG